MSERPKRSTADDGMDELASWLGLKANEGNTSGANDVFAAAFGPSDSYGVLTPDEMPAISQGEEPADIREGFTPQRAEGLPELDPVTQAVINTRQGDPAALDALSAADRELAETLVSIADDHGIETSTLYGAISDPTKNLPAYPEAPAPTQDQPASPPANPDLN